MNKTFPAKIWRMQKFRYRLTGSVCTKCRTKYYPYKSFCPNCYSEKNIKEIELSPFGKIVSWSCLEVAPNGFEQFTPYVIALIKLEDGPTVLSRICDCDQKEVKKGLKVKAVFRKLICSNESEVIKYGIVFELSV